MSLTLQTDPQASDGTFQATAEVIDGELLARRRGKRRNPPVARGLVFSGKVPQMHERASMALGGMFGPTVREVVYCVGNAMQRGHYPVAVAKLILERVLPANRPVQLDLPEMASGADLIEGENKITQALNAGTISPNEARTLQDWARASYRARRVAAVGAK